MDLYHVQPQARQKGPLRSTRDGEVRLLTLGKVLVCWESYRSQVGKSEGEETLQRMGGGRRLESDGFLPSAGRNEQ